MEKFYEQESAYFVLPYSPNTYHNKFWPIGNFLNEHALRGEKTSKPEIFQKALLFVLDVLFLLGLGEILPTPIKVSH